MLNQNKTDETFDEFTLRHQSGSNFLLNTYLLLLIFQLTYLMITIFFKLFYLHILILITFNIIAIVNIFIF